MKRVGTALRAFAHPTLAEPASTMRTHLAAKKGSIVMVFKSLMAIQAGLEAAHDNGQTLDEEERFYKQAYYHACDVDNGTLADASLIIVAGHAEDAMEVTITSGPHTGCHGFVSFHQTKVTNLDALERCSAAKNCVESNEVE